MREMVGTGVMPVEAAGALAASGGVRGRVRAARRAFRLRPLRPLVLALALAFAGCQSSTVDDALDVEGGKGGGVETVGSGAALIGMLAAPGGAAERDRRDGAKLAVMQLGGDQVTLTIDNAGPSTAGVEAMIGKGAKILLGPSRADQLDAIPAGTAARPPVVAFLSNGVARKPGVFAFLFDETDSAVEVASYAVQAGRKRILLLHPPEMERSVLARLRSGIEARGGQVAAALPVSAGADDGLSSQGALLRKVDAVLLGPGLASPAAAVAALRATGALASGALILGTSQLSAERGLAGALVCRVDQADVADVTQRYRAEFGRAMSRDAAYGFDAAALAIGIIRSRGAAALTADTLRARGGFKGLLGAFRFTPSGEIERNCSIYRVDGGKFRMQDPAPSGF